MGCGCNKKKENKSLVSRVEDKVIEKTARVAQTVANTSRMPLISSQKKPVIKNNKK